MTTTNGLLLVDKSRGLTSHDVVAGVRKILDERRVGHAGTLDPMATGLLVLAVGPSTRLLRFAQSGIKRYRGSVQLGVATDSLDADGARTEERPVPHLDPDEMNAAAAEFSGELSQVPPMVSALKVKGQRLHHLARQGIEVERAAREVTVYSFSLSATGDRTVWEFDVECSAGTYVRVLLSDLANRVATVGHLASLRRISSGTFHVDDAVSLEQLRSEVASGRTPLLAPRTFVTELEHVELSGDEQRRVRMGQRLARSETYLGAEIAALDGGGELVAILARRGDVWQPQLVLPDEPRDVRG